MESHNNIEELLEKYFEATTTVAEEKKLRMYFEQDAVAAHLEQYRPMFNYFKQAKTVQYEQGNLRSEPIKPRRKLNFRWVSVAAAVVLSFGVYFGTDTYNNYQEQKQARLAYEQTKEALSLIAANFAKGTEKIAYLQEFEVAKQKVLNNENQ
ncbi:Hypothetical protein I595_654 [Croceitalea dokdonensis DOKDO 023]|uniref:Uncharacterized protein n=1 Tax=Croceitalea dokdonensis DOKDO 023 TaxID=1300341 RepID=A0A0N8H4M0_9FLAO|nr:hypothetical protein [Croceitalea dokdonensis]KPM33748.1 Hypothetical protein I595_654 [Croceitalea dokdonensis DOKDO 023]